MSRYWLRCANYSLLIAVVTAPGCNHFHNSYRKCAEPTSEQLAALPKKLSETGLYQNIKQRQLAEGVRSYRPRYELYSDGATKRRWIYLPKGTKIDSSDQDAWQFPQGTKLWKEFSRDGVVVETRLMKKVGPKPSDWSAVAYIWDSSEEEAVAQPAGQDNARNTPHDVPAAKDCMGCHGGTKSRILGFSAIQLEQRNSLDRWTIPGLVKKGRLSHPPKKEFVVPGDKKTQQALGYLHANCAHCHNQRRPQQEGPRCYDPKRTIDLALYVDGLARPEDTATYRTTIGKVVLPGGADTSQLLRRMIQGGLFNSRMPPLGTEQIDHMGMRHLRRWVNSLDRNQLPYPHQ